MVNKLVASVVLGVTFIIWGLGNAWILKQTPALAGTAVYTTTLALFILLRGQAPAASDIVGSLVESVKAILWYIVWVGIAGVIYVLFNQLYHGGSVDVMALVWSVINTAVIFVTAALVYGALHAVMKAE